MPGEPNNSALRTTGWGRWFRSVGPIQFSQEEIGMGTQSVSAVPQLGELLRLWRQQRGKSQLDLSLDTGISQRHLSFVESGRSVPSRELLSSVSDALNIPLRERNVLLLASGYAPLYSEQSMDTEEMAVVTRAIDRMLQQHDPHPALVLDRHWNVIRTNEAAPRFFWLLHRSGGETKTAQSS
jgi:transcriptional regulator with XRE-family HTH domain